MSQEKTFEESMERLNALVESLEKNDTPLDETIANFEEGLKLVQMLEEKLKGYESKIDEIMKASEQHAE